MKKKILKIAICTALILAFMSVPSFALTKNDNTWKEAKVVIYEAMKACKSSVDLKQYNIPIDDIQDLVQNVRDEYPELFYADAKDYTYYDTDRKVYILNFEYNSLNTSEAKEKYESAISDALHYTNSAMTDLQKVLAIHNYLVKNIKYDTAYNESSHDSYAALVNGKAVCDGYSKAFLDIMNRLDIPCLIVRSEDMDHVWNQVKIDNEWYNIDVTWDDPTPDRGDNVDYTYFLLSDSTITAKEHYGWINETNCVSHKYENGYDWEKESDDMPSTGDIFTDVFNTDYYYKAVLWAYENAVTSGTSATTFSPYGSCTRGQVVRFLWNYAGKPEPKTTENPFTDVKETDWYYKAVLWAYENDITSGTSDTTFSPNMECSNAHIIRFLWNAQGKPSPKTIRASLQNTWFGDAYAWGEENRLYVAMTEGFDATKTAKRADIVLLMYLLL